MLWTIAALLVVAWLLGFVGFGVASSFIHILLVLALIAVLVQLFSGRRVV